MQTTLTNLFKSVNNLLKENGFNWDETRHMVVADNCVWDEYLKVPGIHAEGANYVRSTRGECSTLWRTGCSSPAYPSATSYSSPWTRRPQEYRKELAVQYLKDEASVWWNKVVAQGNMTVREYEEDFDRLRRSERSRGGVDTCESGGREDKVPESGEVVKLVEDNCRNRDLSSVIGVRVKLRSVP
ncbi:Myb/SANT-like domain [Arabidopsis suecica]|uniref:Myb/SANT-like domain n=1 Tax=Arabidopsis suecica TaxID=45249 RepID=A0A8T1ZBK4_ARASU|nr:Myb/SANT-like domain [Arabidopsis suecica]